MIILQIDIIFIIFIIKLKEKILNNLILIVIKLVKNIFK